MKLLVFQHIACEHPGSLRTYLKEDGISWDTVQLDEGGSIPDLAPYDVLWVMGGPMDVWDVDKYPWLTAEKQAIRHWVRDLNRPFLGLCLGHQLLADALGGTCGPAQPPEIGILDVNLTEAASQDPVFSDLPPRQKCLQWHSVEVAQAPEDAVVLASSSACRIQAMRVGDRAWSAQFHIELEPDTVASWGAVPAYKSALEDSLGEGALQRLDAAAAAAMPKFSANSRRFYNGFMKVVRSQAAS